MTLPWRDSIATLFVGIGVVLFGGWAIGAPVPGFESVTAVALGILVLGVAASASAVVPGFGQLLHGSRVYMAGTSIVGLAALIAGIVAVVTTEPLALGVLVISTMVLWAVSTWRHLGAHRSEHRAGTAH